MPSTNIPVKEVAPLDCPAAKNIVKEISEIKALVKEINDRSIDDHTEIVKRASSIDAIPELQKAYQRGKGAFWAFCVFLGITSYFISDIFTVLKLKILG